MLLGRILRAKRTFTTKLNDVIIDLISATFNFEAASGPAQGYVRVKEFEVMRPDLISIRMYADHQYYEPLLKYNGISNPFSLDVNEVLLAPPFKNLDAIVVAPKSVVEKGLELAANNESKLVVPKTVKDKKRLDALKDKVKEIVPPNVNTSGNKNVKVRDGKVIFGEDVTQVNKDNCPVPISRARLIQQLTKANLF